MLILEDGHQPRALAKEKVVRSGYWEIAEETRSFKKYKPKNQPQ